MKELYISQVDAIFANGCYPIEFLHFYKTPLDTRRICASLASLSSVFWPLFGRYREGIIRFEAYVEQEFYDVRAIDRDFDPNDTLENIYRHYSRANPVDMPGLFFLTVLQHRNGTVLIPKMNHLAGDGYSYFYFLSAIARAVQSDGLPDAALEHVHHGRTGLKNFKLGSIELAPPLKTEELTIRYERVAKETVRTLIRKVAGDFDHKVSTNDLLSAMVLRESVSAQRQYAKNHFHLTIPIDVRSHVKKYGPNFFGNGIMLRDMAFTRQETKESSIEEIAIKIRKSMPEISEESYLNYLDSLEDLIDKRRVDELKPFDPESGCLVTNLSRLPANKLNFGAGAPEFIFPLTIEKNSAAILADEEHFILRLAY